MKKHIKEWEAAKIVQTRESEHAVVHICSDGLLQGEENERQKEKVNDLVFDILYRQAEKQARQNLS